ncbi:uncharacterized protein LOC144132383 isoform X1 [Amblyomma americanum]
MDAFAHVLEAVFPDWSEDQRTQVLAYLDLKGVRSVTDVEKINEEELADIIGDQVARTFLECMKMAAGAEATNNEAPPTPVARTSTGSLPADVQKLMSASHSLVQKRGPVASKPAAPIQSLATLGNGATMANLGTVACTTEAAAQSVATAGNITAADMMQMMLAMHQMDSQRTAELMKYEGDKTRELVTTLATLQKGTLDAMKEQMQMTTNTFDKTLTTMNEHMTEQAQWHRDHMKQMGEQMANTNKMHADTIQKMQAAMAAQDTRQAQTLQAMNSSMAQSAAAHEQTMRRMQEEMARRNNSDCVIS